MNSETSTLVKRHDPDRFAAAMFAPTEARADLMALYAFNYEIARVREVVSEAMLGEIRLQWWREALQEIEDGKPPRSHEVVEPLAQAIRRHHLPMEAFERLIDGRARDLDETPFTDLTSLTEYARATAAPLFSLALIVMGEPGRDELTESAGAAYGLAGLLDAVPFHAGAERLYLPGDLLAAHKVDPHDLFVGQSPPGLTAVVEAVAAAARAELDAARRARGRLPRRAMAALLPLVIAKRRLDRLARAGHDPFAPQAPDGIGRPLALLKAMVLRHV